MQKQIASYLFQNRSCPLPGLGTLRVQRSVAIADFSNKLINAPEYAVVFSGEETEPNGLLNYLSANSGEDTWQVQAALDHFCNNLKTQVATEKLVELEGLGNFFINGSGNIEFKEEKLPDAFFQQVVAERVIHPDAEHQMLVGDRETTNTVMTALLSPKLETKDRWWIWASVLGAIGLVTLLIYFTELNGAAPFGNTIKIFN